MSLVNLTSDLSRFRKVVNTEITADDSGLTRVGNGVNFGDYQPLTQKYLSGVSGVSKDHGPQSKLETRQLPTTGAVSTLSPLELQAKDVLPVRKSVDLTTISSRYDDVLAVGKPSGRHTESGITVTSFKSKDEKTSNFKEMPARVVEHTSETRTIPTRHVEHTSEFVVTRTTSGRNNTKSSVEVIRVDTNSVHTSSPVNVIDQDAKDLSYQSTYTPIRSVTSSDEQTVSSVVVTPTVKTGRHESSRIEILANVLPVKHEDTALEVVNTSDVSGRFTSSTVKIVNVTKQPLSDNELDSQFNIDDAPKGFSPSGRHESGNKQSQFNIDGIPVSNSVIGGRYESVRKSQYSFVGKAPETNYFSDEYRRGFDSHTSMLQTLYNKTSEFAVKSGVQKVDMFKNVHAVGFVPFAKLLNTSYKTDASSFVWKGTSKSAPTVNYFKNTHATGFTKFVSGLKTAYVKGSSIYDWDGPKKSAPSVDFFSNVNVDSGFDTFVKPLDTLYKTDSSKYVWKGPRNSAPTTDYFTNTHVSAGFTSFAKMFDTLYVKDSSKYDFDGTSNDAPTTNYFSNVHVRSGFDKFVKLFDTKYIKDASQYDFDGTSKNAPETNFFVNRHVTSGFTKFVKMLDTKYIKDISIYDFDGTSKDAPETDFFVNTHVTSGFTKFTKLLDTKYIKDASQYDFDGTSKDAPSVNFFVNTHVTSGFDTFVSPLETKYIKDVSVHDFDGSSQNAPSVNFFANTNASGFTTFAKMLSSEYVKDSSRYDFDGSSQNAPTTNYFANTNASGFTKFAEMLVSEYQNNSRYTWTGQPPASDVFSNVSVDGFTTFAKMLETKYKTGASRYDWDGSAQSAPQTDFFVNTHAPGFIRFAQFGTTKYNIDSTIRRWTGGKNDAPATNFFVNTYATGFTKFAQPMQSEYNDVSRFSWVGNKFNGPATKMFADDAVVGFTRFQTTTQFIADKSRYTWTGNSKQAPAVDYFSNQYGSSGFQTFRSSVKDTSFTGANVDDLKYDYPELPGYGKRLVPYQPRQYNPEILNLVDLTGAFMPKLSDIVSDLAGFNVGSLSNTSLTGAISRYSPQFLGNKTGYVLRKALGAVTRAVPDSKKLLETSITQLLQKSISNPSLAAIVNNLFLRRSTFSVPDDASNFVVFSVKKQYASSYGNYNQDQGESTMTLDGYNFRSELTKLGIDLPIPGGTEKQERANRLRQKYHAFVPPTTGVTGVFNDLNAVTQILRSNSKLKEIHTIYNPFPQSANVDADEPSRQLTKTNLYIDTLKSRGYMRYGFLDKKAYATYLNETYTSYGTLDSVTQNASMVKKFVNGPQRPQFESKLEKLTKAFNDSATGIGPQGNSKNILDETGIDVNAYNLLNRNPFAKKHDSSRTTALEYGPENYDGTMIKNYRTLAYSKLNRKNSVGNSVAYHDFREKLEDADSTNPSTAVRWSTKAKHANFNKLNLETKYGLGAAGVPGADRSVPYANTVAYTSTDGRGDGSGDSRFNNAVTSQTLDGGNPFRGDRINLIDYRRSNMDVGKLSNVYEKNNTDIPGKDDLIEFYFTGATLKGHKMSPSEVIVFRAILGSIQMSFNPSWDSHTMLGRGEPVYLYQGFENEVSFDFKVFASSRDELKPMWRKLNALASFTAPEYTKAGLIRGPIMRLNMGHLFRKTPGFIKSLSYNIDNTNVTWETAGLVQDKILSDINTMGALQVPKMVDVSVTFQLINNYRPQKNGVMFNLYDDTGNPGKIPSADKNAVNWFKSYDKTTNDSLGLPAGIEDEAKAPKFDPNSNDNGVA